MQNMVAPRPNGVHAPPLPPPPAGVYACRTSALLPWLQKWNNSDE